MKRILRTITLLLFILLLSQTCYGDSLQEYCYVVEFGTYEQDNDLSNGKEPIEWYILERGETEVLLISKYALNCMPYNRPDNGKDGAVTWPTCSLRVWLNDAFYSGAFSEEEKKLIEDCKNTNSREDGNPKYDTQATIATTDKVGLLSYAEYNEYVGEADECYSTAYAQSCGLKEKTTWWLRSPGKKQTEASVCGKGKAASTAVSDESVGVRPVIQLDLSIAHETMPLDTYVAAVDALVADDYVTGMNLFDSLGEYQDAEFMTSACKLLYAEEVIDEDSEEALKRLKDYEEYSIEKLDFCLDDYYAMLPIAEYNAACARMENGDYAGAMDLYYAITYYEDCAEELIECFEKLKVPYHWMTQSNSVVNAGDNDEYSISKEITAKDPHFGWSLGRFLISGYTEYDDSGSIPVIVKTPGDDVRLLFAVEQDIDALNGNEKLVIEENEKGSDRQFQIRKTNFGRGALIVCHEKANGDTDVATYFDYLTALTYGTADTAIEIKEEGTYEVALDYRIKEDKAFGDHNDYRILFKFKVKNGSGMSYLFDIETGAELNDCSVTDAGFRIDLANSKSLSVNVTRYAINAAENGLDVRSTAPAADGEKFDKTGYYEVTTTNKETGEKITKRLFVGRNSDLEDFIEVSPELEAFMG